MVGADVVDEHLVDLDNVDAELLEIGETAVAGAAVGQVGTLRYRQGQAQLAPSKDQDRAHTLSR